MNYYIYFALFIGLFLALVLIIKEALLKVKVSGDVIKINNFTKSQTIKLEEVSKINTEIKGNMIETSISYKGQDEKKKEIKISSYFNGYYDALKDLVDNTQGKIDLATYIVAEDENFKTALKKLKNEYRKKPMEYTDDDLHSEDLFDSVVKFISKPMQTDVKNIRYIINSNIENPKDLLLFDDITGTFTTSLFNIGYDVTSVQYTDAAKDHVENIAKKENLNPDIYSIKFHDMDLIKEHDAALLIYPTHLYYGESQLEKFFTNIYSNLKNNGALVINNKFKLNIKTQFFVSSKGFMMEEPVIGIISNSKSGKKVIYKYIEVGLETMKVSSRYSLKWLWNTREIKKMALKCGFRFLDTFSRNKVILFAKNN